MIKIIKNPIETFIMKCPICECEFSYEVSDVDTLTITPNVRCPGCGYKLPHTRAFQKYVETLENALRDKE